MDSDWKTDKFTYSKKSKCMYTIKIFQCAVDVHCTILGQSVCSIYYVELSERNVCIISICSDLINSEMEKDFDANCSNKALRFLKYLNYLLLQMLTMESKPNQRARLK